jgi:hypothetical protein
VVPADSSAMAGAARHTSHTTARATRRRMRPRGFSRGGRSSKTTAVKAKCTLRLFLRAGELAGQLAADKAASGGHIVPKLRFPGSVAPHWPPMARALQGPAGPTPAPAGDVYPLTAHQFLTPAIVLGLLVFSPARRQPHGEIR